MTQLVFITFKDGSERTIKCNHFTLTSVGVLVLSYKEHAEEIDMEEVSYFGGCAINEIR